MKIDIHSSRNLLVEHGKTIEEVLRQSVRQALADHKRARNRVASWADGRVVFIEPEDINVGDATVEARI